MDKKYKLTDEVMRYEGRTLHRIQALRDFGLASKGELGGWVQSEDNLSHNGICWVRDNAIVMERAHVRHDALISEDAVVRGGAGVFDDTFVGQCAVVGDKAQVRGSARVYGNAIVKYASVVAGNATVFGHAVVDEAAFVANNSVIKDNVIVKGDARVLGRAIIEGNAIVQSDADYIVFKNNFSSGRFFTWTRSNDMWSVGCFYGTADQLLEKAKKDGEKVYQGYKLYVDLVETLKKVVG